jgi:Protein of unknown function (DUF1583)
MHTSDLVLLVAFSGLGLGPEQFVVDFRPGTSLPAELVPRNGRAARLTHSAPGGLQVLLPATRKDLDQVALDTTFGIGGNLDIVATYEIMKSDLPEEGYGIGLMLSIKSATPKKQGRVGWMLRGGGKEVAVWDQGEAKADDKMNFKGGEEKWASRLGRLRLRRTGETLEYSIARGVVGDNFQVLHRWQFGSSDIDLVSLLAFTEKRPKTLEARWLDLSVQGDELLRGDQKSRPAIGSSQSSPSSHPSEPSQASHLLWIGLLAGFVIVFGGLFRLWKHKHKKVHRTDMGPVP